MQTNDDKFNAHHVESEPDEFAVVINAQPEKPLQMDLSKRKRSSLPASVDNAHEATSRQTDCKRRV